MTTYYRPEDDPNRVTAQDIEVLLVTIELLTGHPYGQGLVIRLSDLADETQFEQSRLQRTIKVAETQGLLERKSVRAATTRLTCYTVLKGRSRK